MSAMTVSTAKMTAEQFLRLGEDPPGVRLELVEGEVAVSPSPSPAHSYAENMLATILTLHVSERNLGEVFRDVDTLVSAFNVRRPDILYFSRSRLHLVGEQAMEGPPDLCVEVVSPSSGKIDRHDKFEQYRRFGVPHYWIVDPASRTFEAFSLESGSYSPAATARNENTVSAPPFTDLQVPLGRLWRKQT